MENFLKYKAWYNLGGSTILATFTYILIYMNIYCTVWVSTVPGHKGYASHSLFLP